MADPPALESPEEEELDKRDPAESGPLWQGGQRYLWWRLEDSLKLLKKLDPDNPHLRGDKDVRINTGGPSEEYVKILEDEVEDIREARRKTSPRTKPNSPPSSVCYCESKLVELPRTRLSSFKVPKNLQFGTATFGNYAHEEIAKQLEDMFPDVLFEFNIRPGETGVDVIVPEEAASRVGFEYAEIKPLTPSGEASFMRQSENWRFSPGELEAITYDANGNVYLGFH